MPSISFKSVVHNNVVEIPQEYHGDFSSPVLVTISAEKHAGRFSSPKIIPRRGAGQKKFSEPHLDTTGWKFNREEANER
jgi:hypothetical protein